MSLRIISTLKKIHEENFTKIINFNEVIEELFYDYGIEKDEDLPFWFREMFELINNKKIKTIFFRKTDSNTSSLLLEFAGELGWDIDDYGEGVVMKFENNGIRVLVSREALDENKKPCCSVSLSEL
jgi:hypothetical protein